MMLPTLRLPCEYKAERILAGRNDLIYLLEQLYHAGQRGVIMVNMDGNFANGWSLPCGPDFTRIGINMPGLSQAISDCLFNNISYGCDVSIKTHIAIDMNNRCINAITSVYTAYYEDRVIYGWRISVTPKFALTEIPENLCERSLKWCTEPPERFHGH